MDAGLKKTIEVAGGVRALSRLLDINHSAVLNWESVPIHHVFDLEEKLGLTREELRPDIFLRPRPKKRASRAL